MGVFCVVFYHLLFELPILGVVNNNLHMSSGSSGYEEVNNEMLTPSRRSWDKGWKFEEAKGDQWEPISAVNDLNDGFFSIKIWVGLSVFPTVLVACKLKVPGDNHI